MEEKRAEELVERYADLLLRIGYAWFSNLYDAQDVCQTVLLKCLEHGCEFSDLGQERAWVIRVTVNACKNMKRSAWRRRTVPLEEMENLLEAPPESADGILSQVGRLPLKYRQVIYLRYYEDYSVKEIAELLGVKSALVSTWLARARARLKTMLEEEEYETGILQ